MTNKFNCRPAAFRLFCPATGRLSIFVWNFKIQPPFLPEIISNTSCCLMQTLPGRFPVGLAPIGLQLVLYSNATMFTWSSFLHYHLYESARFDACLRVRSCFAVAKWSLFTYSVADGIGSKWPTPLGPVFFFSGQVWRQDFRHFSKSHLYLFCVKQSSVPLQHVESCWTCTTSNLKRKERTFELAPAVIVTFVHHFRSNRCFRHSPSTSLYASHAPPTLRSAQSICLYAQSPLGFTQVLVFFVFRSLRTLTGRDLRR